MTSNRTGDGRPAPPRARALRRVHAIAGLASAPFTIISGVCGGLLLLRKTGPYERRGA